MQKPLLYAILLSLYGAVLIWSAIGPKDYFTWFLEVLPALIGLAVILATYKRFRLTPLTYLLIFLHCCILFVGGHYTYAEVPLFDWVREVLGQSRNNYDKVGHFAQGLVPAMITRELFIRQEIIAKKGWIPFLTICTCLAISAAYEFLEWGVALLTGEGADAFLGTQSYVWDTQSDMLYATIGAMAGLLLFSKLHDRQMLKLRIKPSPPKVSGKVKVAA